MFWCIFSTFEPFVHNETAFLITWSVLWDPARSAQRWTQMSRWFSLKPDVTVLMFSIALTNMWKHCAMKNPVRRLFHDLKQYHPWENVCIKIFCYRKKDWKKILLMHNLKIFWNTHLCIIKVLNIVPKICEMFSCLARTFWEIHVIFNFSLLY